MTATKPRLVGGAVLAVAFAMAPMPVAPVWTAVTWPLAALFLVFEIQVWISMPRKWRGSSRPVAADAIPAPAPLAAPVPAPETTAYLDLVDASLGLPAEVRAEIRAELSDHLEDSIEALEAEGLDRPRAIREALARLGRAEELARQLRAAHQSTRRLLAGAAGGVWSAGVGVAQGYLAVFGFWMISIDLGILLLQKPFYQTMDFWTGSGFGSADLGAPIALFCMMGWAPSFLAGRRSVRASARLSRRGARRLRGFWAIAGLLALGWLVLFGLRVQQSWLVVPCELAMPILFAAGALMRPDENLHLPKSRARLLLVPGALIVAGLLMGAAVPLPNQYSPDNSPSFSNYPSASDLGYNRVGPAASCVPANQYYAGDSCVLLGDSDLDWMGPGKPSTRQVVEPWDIVDSRGLTGFTDIRFEIWRGRIVTITADPPSAVQEEFSQYGLDPTASRPEVTVAAVIDGDQLRLVGNLGNTRWRHWLVFVTGVGADGRRYRLAEPYSLETTFTGTAWDWLTASD